MQTREKTQLMSASEVDRTLVRLAHELLERTADPSEIALIGIERRGAPLAQRLARKLEEIEGHAVPVGSVDIRHYRDDHVPVEPPVVNSSEIGFDISGKDVVLVDDVLHTGRTVRAGLEALLRQGRPARVQLLVLIDRGHRELPIEARYVGRTVPTKASELVHVQLMEVDGVERVTLAERVS